MDISQIRKKRKYVQLITWKLFYNLKAKNYEKKKKKERNVILHWTISNQFGGKVLKMVLFVSRFDS